MKLEKHNCSQFITCKKEQRIVALRAIINSKSMIFIVTLIDPTVSCPDNPVTMFQNM